MFALASDRYSEPVLVASTDGVGTKMLLARAMGHLDTIGIDLVAMCVDDVVCTGAEPLFFLDYLAVGKLDPDQVEELVDGVAEGCRQAGCALLGGEMAEHPGAMPADEVELAGFAVGVAERSRLVTGEHLHPGDVLVGLPSPGLRCNGYSLARRVLLEVAGRSLEEPAYDGAPGTLGDELLRPSLIYTPAVVGLCREVDVRVAAHVTGGGLAGNLERVLHAGVDVVVDSSTWETPRIFGEIQRAGQVSDSEMARVFNLGLGMVIAVPADESGRTLELLAGHGHRAAIVGEAVEGTPGEPGLVRFSAGVGSA